MDVRERHSRGNLHDALSYLVESLTQVVAAHFQLAQKEMLDSAQHHARLVWRLAVWAPFLVVGVLSMNAAVVLWLHSWLPLWVSAAAVGALNLVGPVWTWHSFSKQPMPNKWFEQSQAELNATLRAVTNHPSKPENEDA